MRCLSLILGGVLVLAGCSGSGTGASATGGLELLHAVRGHNPGIFDEHQRQVLLRGVNYNVLGDYYQQYPEYATTIPPADDDLPRMAGIGLNSIRLVLSWSAIEVQPGVYDEDYLSRVREQVEKAAQNGIYVVLDMHQDKWGKYIASPPGTTCTPPWLPANGWDGAPQWATDFGSLSTCYFDSGEVSLAVADSFQNFYDDKNGIQTHFIAMWQHLVGEFASYPNVAGYDLFNEPNPGFLPIFAGGGTEAKFYGKLITAIRQTEQSTPGALPHIVFFEPGAEWSLLGDDQTPPADFTSDTNIVFAPHNYCGSLSVDANISDCFQHSQQHAATYQTTFWTGEWGFFSDPAGIAAPDKAFAKAEDDAITGSALWQWEQACGDPNTLSSVGAQPPPALYHLNQVLCPQSQQVGFVQENEVVVSRAYPRAAPGYLQSLQSDPDTGAMTLTGQTAQPGTAVLWVPDRGLGTPQVSGQNVSNASVTKVNGGFVIQADVNGSYTIAEQAGS